MQKLKKVLNEVGLCINDTQIKKLQTYLQLLLAWNKRTNLVSRSDESRLIDRHILESLAALLMVKIQPGARILDIGSGAGFPSLPISLVCPDAYFTLVESKRLKVLFLQEVVNQLNLSHVQVICDRIENWVKDSNWKEGFDFAFSRAVASLEIVYGWIQNLIKVNGFYLAWKGGDVHQELEILRKKFPKIKVDVMKMDKRLVNPDRERRIVRIQRTGKNAEV